MKFVLALIAALAFAAPAAAQHKHGADHKGPNGGPVEDVAGVHAELVVERRDHHAQHPRRGQQAAEDGGLQRHGARRERAASARPWRSLRPARAR